MRCINERLGVVELLVQRLMSLNEKVCGKRV